MNSTFGYTVIIAQNVQPQKTTDMGNKGTYKRKYYLHRMLKKQGFSLHLEHKRKTINVEPEHVDEAKQNKYVAELQNKFSYGVQILNPVML